MRKVVWSAAVMIACLAGAGTAQAQSATGAGQPAQGASPQRARLVTQKRLAKRFKAMDLNGDGSISRDEWKGQARVFDRLDANHDGVLSPQELRRAMRRAAVRRRR